MSREVVFSDTHEHFTALLQDIEQAQHTIDLETYIFRKDALGKKIADALIKCAERGVAVRVLVDGAGTPMWSTHFARALEKAGAKTKVFHPFPWQLWNWNRSSLKSPWLLKWIFLLLKANSRNHRKVCLIDRKIAYIGSANISECHLPKLQGGDGWRDISVRLNRTDLSAFIDAFDSAWTHKSIPGRLRETFRQVRKDPSIRLNNNRHRRRVLYRHLLRRIRNCQKRIWITNAYFVPDNFLLKRLKEAAKKGIDVRILLPKKSDVLMMPWASSTFYFSLLKAGVRIFEYLPSNLHAKSLILDDWVLVGSSNLNHRSLLHDLEADVRIRLSSNKQKLAKTFLEDLEASKEILLATFTQQRPWLQRSLGRLVLYIKYWI